MSSFSEWSNNKVKGQLSTQQNSADKTQLPSGTKNFSDWSNKKYGVATPAKNKTASTAKPLMTAAQAMKAGNSTYLKSTSPYLMSKGLALPKAETKKQTSLPQIKALGAGDYDKTTRFDRMVNSAALGTAANYGEINAQLLAPTGELTMGESARAALKKVSQSTLEKEKYNRQKATQERRYKAVDDLSKRAAEEEEKAKKGLGGFGKTMVDLGTTGLQMLPDIALGAIVPGGTLIGMGARSYGQGAGMARQGGGNQLQQTAYGSLYAATQVLTEKMFDGLAGLYGKGTADKLVEGVLKKVNNKYGRTALRTLINMSGEGFEEIAADVVDPLMRSIYNGKSVGENYSEEKISDWLYDGLIGALMGGIGGGVSLVNGENAAKNNAILDEKAADAEAARSFSHTDERIPGVNDYGLKTARIDNVSDYGLKKFQRSFKDRNTGWVNPAVLPGNVKAELDAARANGLATGNVSEVGDVRPLPTGETSNNSQNLKSKQAATVMDANPINDEYHTGIRSAQDIKTFDETLDDAESFVYGDFSREDAQKALETGKVTVFSSYPIGTVGGFVSTSRNMAADYAGKGKVYSKEVPLTDVAWINGDEGQYSGNVGNNALPEPEAEQAPDVRPLPTGDTAEKSNPAEANNQRPVGKSRSENEKRNRATFKERLSEIFSTVKHRAIMDALSDIGMEAQHSQTPDINKIYAVFENLWNSSTTRVEADAAYKTAADAIKGRKVFVNDNIRSEIGDDWKSVSAKARAVGLYFTKDVNDRGVDVLNSELAEMYPGMFDAESTDQTQMLYDFVDVLERSKDSSVDLPTGLEKQYGKNASEEAKNETYKEFMKAVTELYDNTRADNAATEANISKARQAKAEAPQKAVEAAKNIEKPGGQSYTPSMTKAGLGEFPIDSDVSYFGASQMAAQENAAFKTRKILEKAEKDLKPSRGESRFARGIADGTYTEEDIPLRMDSQKIKKLADYYAADMSYKKSAIAERAKENRDAREETADKLTINSDQNTPPKALYLNFNTMKRNIEKSFGKDAPALITEYIDPIRENSKNKKLWTMAKREGLTKFKLTANESALVQQVMEGKAAQEEMAKLPENESKSIQAVAHNIGNGLSRAEANADFNLSPAQLDLAERYLKWQHTQASVKTADADKINGAAKWLTEQYNDLYDAINDFLVSHGYKTIGFVKGYAPHLQSDKAMEGLAGFLQRMGLATEVVELPTEIAGRTETFRPGKSWDPNFLSRSQGKNYTDDAVAGWESYIDYMSNVFYHTDDIQKLRALSQSLRSKYASNEIKEQISWAKNMRDAPPVDKTRELQKLGIVAKGVELTKEQADFQWNKYIDSLFENIKNLTKFGDFVSVLDDYTNKLAMKQTALDRSIEHLIGRKKLNLGNQLTKIFGESTIVGNLSSAFNQTAQLPMLQAELGNKYVREALWDIMKGELKSEEFEKRSAFLVGKMNVKSATASRAWSDKTAKEKHATIMDVGAIPFEAVDDFTSRLIVRSKYLQMIDRGLGPEAAIIAADEYADRLVGSREQGMKPMIFENKNAFVKLFTTFQLEVANNWNHITHDMPAEYKAVESSQGKTAAVKLMTGRIIKYLITAFLLNRTTDEVYGGTPAPMDLLGYILGGVAAGYGKSTNTYIATAIDNASEQLGGDRLFGTKGNGKFNAADAAEQVGYLAGGDVPYLSSAGSMLGITDTTLPIPQVLNSKMTSGAKGLLKAEDAESRKAALETLGEGVGKAATTWLPMGNQLRKTTSGVKALLKGGEYSGGQMEYPVDTSGPKGLLTGAKAVAFGVNSTQAAQNYWAGGGKKLTKAQTTAYQDAVKAGDKPQDVYDTIQDVKSQKKTDTETQQQAKLKALQSSDISDKAKRVLYSAMISDDHAYDIAKLLMVEGGKTLKFDDYIDIQYKYADINKTDKDATDKATEFASWLNTKGYSKAQQLAAKNAFKYWQQMPAEATTYEDLIKAGLSDKKANLVYEAISPIKADTTEGKYKRYRAAVNACTNSNDALAVMSAMLPDETYSKMATGYDYGVSPAVYLTYTEQLSKLESKSQANIKNVLNGLIGLNNEQRAALYQLANKSWKGYKNPYSTAVGSEIYNKYND